MNRIHAAVVTSLFVSSLSAAPVVTGVKLTQDEVRRATIEYTLEGSLPAYVKVTVLTNGVSIGEEPLKDAKGVVSGIVQPGKQTILWKPTKSWPGYVFKNNELSVSVKATSLNATPDYMILDLENPSDIRFYDTTAEFPTALGDDCYRKRYIVMRKIPAAGVQWRMGSPESELNTIGSWFGPTKNKYENTHYVTLTQDFYLSIYELTQYQYGYVDTGATSGSVLPIGKSYNQLRGTGKVWPADGHTLDGSGWLSKMRTLFSDVYAFDLPTEAQWEFACRAGTATTWNNGKNVANGDGTYEDKNLNAVAWYAKNAGSVSHAGGNLAANNYGLYDMHGNFDEVCLDNVGGDALSPYDSEPATDPKGSTTVSDLVITRGGAYWDSQYTVRSGQRNTVSRQETSAMYKSGVRLCVTLP